MKKICVISNDHKDKELVLTNRITNYLNLKGCETVVSLIKWDFELEQWTKPENVPADADYILVVGGDGTLLQVARHTYGMNIPLLGINLGRLGFLTEVDEPHLEESLQKLLDEEYTIEERTMLQGTIHTKNGEFHNVALNDIVVNRTGALQIVYFDVFLNREFVRKYKADGYIVSTATGSTGYNLSAGGPILDPESDSVVMINICPHNLFNRGVVLPKDKLITILISEDKQEQNQQVDATFDGCDKFKLNSGDYIDITTAPFTTKIIRLESVSFMKILHNKMSPT